MTKVVAPVVLKSNPKTSLLLSSFDKEKKKTKKKQPL